jgi:hypothetical protein
MSDVRPIAKLFRRGQRPHRSASNASNHLQHDDFASLLLRPKVATCSSPRLTPGISGVRKF